MKNLKNKKGFTLVELMAVIAILAVIITIAVPSAISISHKIKIKMYNTKVKMVISGAELYGQDSTNVVGAVVERKSDCGSTNGKVNITKLMNGYIKKDDIENGHVLNPVDNSTIDNYELCVYKENRRIYAKLLNCDSTWNKDGYLNAEIKQYCN